MKSPAESARTWKGNDYQAVWWDEAARLDEAKQFQDHARKVILKCTEDLVNSFNRFLEAAHHAEIRGKFWAGKLPDTVSNAELEAALSSKMDQ